MIERLSVLCRNMKPFCGYVMMTYLWEGFLVRPASQTDAPMLLKVQAETQEVTHHFIIS